MGYVYSKFAKVGMFALAMTASANLLASQMDERYYQVTQVETKETVQILADKNGPGGLTVVPNGIAMGTCENNRGASVVPGFEDPIGALEGTEVIVDKVINIGRKIWNIVLAGKPSLNIQTDVATALPQGARCWQDLQTWQMPQSKVYETSFKNGFGMEVVRMNYRVIWLPGGSYEGKGAFIGYAAIVPTDVHVSWGFNVSAQASVPTVFNMGTKQDPVGGMQLSMIYRIETPVQTTEQSQAYFVNGKGEFNQLN